MTGVDTIAGQGPRTPRDYGDVNAVIGGYLRDPAFVQSSAPKVLER